MTKLLKKASIKLKLLIGFLFIAAISVAVGLVGTISMDKIADHSETMYSYNLASIDDLHIIKENLLNVRTQLQKAVLYQDPDQTKDSIESIDEFTQINETYIDSYDKFSLSDKAREIWNNFLTDMDAYRTAREEVLTLASAGKYEEASNSLSSVTQIRESMFDKLNQLIELNQQMAQASDAENKGLANTSSTTMSMMIVVGLILSIFIGLRLSLNISKSINKGLEFASALGEGDLTVVIKNSSQDELGRMIDALNLAKDNMRKIVSSIVVQTEEVSASSEELSATLEEVSQSFETMNTSTSTISDGVMDIRAATEELTATVEQVNTGVTQLATSSSDGSKEAVDIKARAIQIKDKGTESRQLADSMYHDKQVNILDAIEKGKVVEEISNIANLINDIASQTNLLALNASIEAARAGEHGRGFAVVASEIGALAAQSTNYVREITDVVNNVKNAFSNLADNSKEILGYVDTRVRGDYDLLVDTGINYEKDAIYVSSLSQDTASMAQELNASTEEITSVIQTIASNIEDTAISFTQIQENMNETNIAMEQIAKTAENQATIAETLNKLTSGFKI